MSKIKEKIESVNRKNQKALTIFLTSGYPDPDTFVELALGIVDSGADILEIGVPFGDSLADGPVVQASYIKSINQGVNLYKTFELIAQIKKYSDVPVVLMGSGNPVLNIGKESFIDRAAEAKINGVIIPDVPLEEYDNFIDDRFKGLDTILLTTPTSSRERIRDIDDKSSGFVYCVSVVGTTGIRKQVDEYVYDNLKLTYDTLEKNKMQIGFGISSPERVKEFTPYCDGVIVGSAIIKSLESDDKKYTNTMAFVKSLKEACYY
ncbi:MAG: tryptophan synthase subunit alpha [Melioribacteraceae bacterium]|nr:tryptophan synthase subunit alpha [Melioribacteraceae bacterium]